jgi:hypothetical protein
MIDYTARRMHCRASGVCVMVLEIRILFIILQYQKSSEAGRIGPIDLFILFLQIKEIPDVFFSLWWS